MNDYQKRVISQEKDISVEIDRHVNFMHGDSYSKLDSVNQGLLMVQLVAMQNYMVALSRRIELFN